MNFSNLLGSAALAAGFLFTQGSFAADAQKGKTAYVKNGCWQCHGFVGQGGGAGPKLAPEPMALAALVPFLRHTNGAMPPYPEPVLSDGDIADIHAYLETVPKTADYKSIPLLRN